MLGVDVFVRRSKGRLYIFLLFIFDVRTMSDAVFDCIYYILCLVSNL
jgi:hypothetical protein